MATPNSANTGPGFSRRVWNRKPRLRAAGVALLAAVLMHGSRGLFSQAAAAAAPATNTTTFAAMAEKSYLAARTAMKADPKAAEPAWQFARAAFEWAEFGSNDTHRAAIALEGIDACRQLLGRNPNLGAGHYYLALNLGRLADTRRNLSALRMVDEIEAEFKLALAQDPKVDFAGPDRGLGNLYLDAPGWPVSVGSKTKARQHLRRAVELCPDFPENQLSLIEACLKWGEKKSAQPMLATFEKVLEKARSQFTGEAWANAWQDWEHRWKKIKERLR